MDRNVQKWASSLLFIANKGWFRNVIISIDTHLQSVVISPLNNEIANTQWLHSGVILLSFKEILNVEATKKVDASLFVDKELDWSENSKTHVLSDSFIYFCSPFDLIQKRPVDETRHKLLR